MNSIKRLRLSEFVSGLIAAGSVVFTAEEAVQALGISHGAFLDAAERLQRRKQLLSPRRGFYVVVHPQFATWGAPPPSWYIDALMQREGSAYYVGLLKAAELHGASHQAIMEFQVLGAKRMPRIRAGRSIIAFYYRGNMETVGAGIEDYKTDTGSMKISSPALTALDLLRYPRASGGIDHIATVLSDLAPGIHPMRLAGLSVRVERPIVQRLGSLLSLIGHEERAKPMFDTLRGRGPLPWAEFDPQQAHERFQAPARARRDPRWRVIIRREPQPDA